MNNRQADFSRPFNELLRYVRIMDIERCYELIQQWQSREFSQDEVNQLLTLSARWQFIEIATFLNAIKAKFDDHEYRDSDCWLAVAKGYAAAGKFDDDMRGVVGKFSIDDSSVVKLVAAEFIKNGFFNQLDLFLAHCDKNREYLEISPDAWLRYFIETSSLHQIKQHQILDDVFLRVFVEMLDNKTSAEVLLEAIYDYRCIGDEIISSVNEKAKIKLPSSSQFLYDNDQGFNTFFEVIKKINDRPELHENDDFKKIARNVFSAVVIGKKLHYKDVNEYLIGLFLKCYRIASTEAPDNREKYLVDRLIAAIEMANEFFTGHAFNEVEQTAEADERDEDKDKLKKEHNDFIKTCFVDEIIKSCELGEVKIIKLLNNKKIQEVIEVYARKLIIEILKVAGFPLSSAEIRAFNKAINTIILEKLRLFDLECNSFELICSSIEGCNLSLIVADDGGYQLFTAMVSDCLVDLKGKLESPDLGDESRAVKTAGKKGGGKNKGGNEYAIKAAEENILMLEKLSEFLRDCRSLGGSSDDVSIPEMPAEVLRLLKNNALINKMISSYKSKLQSRLLCGFTATIATDTHNVCQTISDDSYIKLRPVRTVNSCHTLLRRLDSLARLINVNLVKVLIEEPKKRSKKEKIDEQNKKRVMSACAAVTIYKNKLYVSFNRPQNEAEFLKLDFSPEIERRLTLIRDSICQIKNQKSTEKDDIVRYIKENIIGNILGPDHGFGNDDIDRLVADFYKVAMCFPDLPDLSAVKIIKSVNDRYRFGNKVQLHAEWILYHAINDMISEDLSPPRKLYFGISKLCCVDCMYELNKYNHENPQFRVITRGGHGKAFDGVHTTYEGGIDRIANEIECEDCELNLSASVSSVEDLVALRGSIDQHDEAYQLSDTEASFENAGYAHHRDILFSVSNQDPFADLSDEGRSPSPEFKDF